MANIYISRGLANDGIIPDKVLNPKEIIDMLDHDKPEGDDVLEKITGIIHVESKLDIVELKKDRFILTNLKIIPQHIATL